MQHFQVLGHRFSLYGAPSRQVAYIYFHQLSSPKLFFRYETSCEVLVFLQKQFLSGVDIKAKWNQTRFTGLWGCVEYPHFVRAIEHFFRVYIASSIHSRGWENSRKLCKSSTTFVVCITVSNSSNPPRVKPKCALLVVAVLFYIGNLLYNSRQQKSFFDAVKEERSRMINLKV